MASFIEGSKLRWQTVIDGLASVAIIITAVLLATSWWSRSGPFQSNRQSQARSVAPLPQDAISIDGVAARGTASARVGIIEYSDFQCPYCGRFARETFPLIQKKYVDTGKVRIFFRHRPLAAIHPYALKASEAAECAHRQNKFWEMHDSLFARQEALNETSLLDRAHEIGLNENLFRTCLTGQATDLVKSDDASGTAVSIAGTPAFLIGTMQRDGRIKITQRLMGALPIQEFEKVLDPLITTVERASR